MAGIAVDTLHRHVAGHGRTATRSVASGGAARTAATAATDTEREQAHEHQTERPIPRDSIGIAE